jgi:hypothetical protein
MRQGLERDSHWVEKAYPGGAGEALAAPPQEQQQQAGLPWESFLDFSVRRMTRWRHGARETHATPMF